MKVKYIKENGCPKTPDYSSDEPLQYLSLTLIQNQRNIIAQNWKEYFRICFPYLFKLRGAIQQ